VQDQEGFLWLSTNQELLKFDGYEVEIYRHDPEDSTSLTGNHVGKLFVDTEGNLWAGNTKGLSRYRPNCYCFVNYTLSSTHKSAYMDAVFQNHFYSVPQESVVAITEDRDLQLWAATAGGDLFRYDRKQDTFIAYRNDPKATGAIPPLFINVLLADRHNNLWIGAGREREEGGSGLIRLDLNTGETRQFIHEPGNVNSLIDSRVTALFEDQQGRILVGTFKSGLHRYDPDAAHFIRLQYDPARPNALHAPFAGEQLLGDYPPLTILHQDQKGGFWVGTSGKSLYHFDGHTGKLKSYAYDNGQPNHFVHNDFSTLFEDRQGQLWLGTYRSGGLFKKENYTPKFTWYPSLRRAQRSCESKTAPDIFWISSMGEGLRRLNRKTGAIKTYLHDENNPNSIGNDQVRAVYEGDDGILWIGIGDGGYGGNESGKGGLDRLDTRTGIFKHYTFKRRDKPNFNWTVYALYEDGEGRLWCDTGSGGIFRSDRQKKTFEPYPVVGSEDAELWLIPGNNKNGLWVTDFTKKIMYRYESEKDQFVSVIKGDVAEVVLEDESGFWIPTVNQGLLHIDPNTGSTQRFTEEDGLPSNETIDIQSTKVGTYWVATRKGLTKFDARTKTFHNGGMPRGYFHPILLKSKDGQLFFGADEGIVAFYPEEVEGNPVPPELAFRHLQISGEPFPLVKEENGKYKKLHLYSQQNDFNIAYVGLHFSDPERNKYQYKLSPFDKEWKDAGTQRTVQYTNLPPGEYTFAVKAANRDGVWTQEALVLPFHIRAAWWTSWWFYSLSLALIAGLGYWFYHFQLSKTLAVQTSIRLQEVNQLKTTLYNNITHEFRTPLTVILGMTENLKSEMVQQQLDHFVPPLQMIARNGQNLLQLVNEMLDLAKVESGNLALNLVQGEVISFVKYLLESFHALAARQHIQLDIQAVEQTLVMDFDPHKLTIVVSNLLSNALKFVPEGGAITVQLDTVFRAGAGRFSISVKDNGIGIAAEEMPHLFDRFYQADQAAGRRYQGNGIGLALTKELVALMKGTIQVESEPGKGSEFTVLLPIHRNAALAESKADGSVLAYSQNMVENYFQEGLPQEDDMELPLVLVIEDQADVVHYISTCLQGKYRYVHAANGMIGIETAFEKIPDLVICDVMMPEKDGFEVCATLKKDERTNHIPVIMLTARVAAADRLAGLAQGADAYLTKPFEKKELLIRLQQLFELRKTLQKKYGEQLFLDTPDEKTGPAEDPFMARARVIVLAELENEYFSVNELSDKLYLSRSQVHRKIKAVTGMSTAIFIRMIRMQEAKKLLRTTPLTISEIAYQTGFKTLSYFSQLFKQTFGESPSDFRK